MYLNSFMADNPFSGKSSHPSTDASLKVACLPRKNNKYVVFSKTNCQVCTVFMVNSKIISDLSYLSSERRHKWCDLVYQDTFLDIQVNRISFKVPFQDHRKWYQETKKPQFMLNNSHFICGKFYTHLSECKCIDVQHQSRGNSLAKKMKWNIDTSLLKLNS